VTRGTFASLPDEQGNGIPNDPAFAVAVASLRQALQSLPDLTETSKHIMVRETGEGLNIDIVDQDGASMFQEGSREPYERIRQLLQMIAGPLKTAPYRISIAGHTSGPEG
jgi:chemotaxis protein MotB